MQKTLDTVRTQPIIPCGTNTYKNMNIQGTKTNFEFVIDK